MKAAVEIHSHVPDLLQRVLLKRRKRIWASGIKDFWKFYVQLWLLSINTYFISSHPIPLLYSQTFIVPTSWAVFFFYLMTSHSDVCLDMGVYYLKMTTIPSSSQLTIDPQVELAINDALFHLCLYFGWIDLLQVFWMHSKFL